MAIKTGAQVLVEIFQKEGVEYVFGVPGATEVLFLDTLEKQDLIKYILCLQETVAVGAAEGYARTSGKVGVLNLHTRAGLAAGMGMLVNAYQGGVPLLVTAGQNDSRVLLQEPHLSGPLAEIARPLTKWSVEVDYAENIPVLIQRGLKVAMQPPTGPVFISLPQNLLAESLEYEFTPGTPLLVRTRPDTDALYRANDLLLNAKKPVFFLEDGVAKNKAVSEVVKLAELVGAEVYQSWTSDVNFPNQHPQYLGELFPPSRLMKETLKDCDVLVVIGARLFSYQGYSPEPILEKSTRIIQIDDNPWQIAKNLPVSVALQGHIREAVSELTSLIAKKGSPSDVEAAQKRIEAIAARKKEKMAALMSRAQAGSHDIPISVPWFVQELKKVLPEGTLLVDDAWGSSEPARQLLDLKEIGDFQRSRQGGSIGWGMTGPIGVKLAAPDRPVVSVSGDGSAAWSIQGLWTAAHYHLPITFIVLANKRYHTPSSRWAEIPGGKPAARHESLELDNPQMDFCKMAEGMGVHAVKVDRPEDLGKTLKQAFSSGQPELVEINARPYP